MTVIAYIPSQAGRGSAAAISHILGRHTVRGRLARQLASSRQTQTPVKAQAVSFRPNFLLRVSENRVVDQVGG